MAWSMYTDLRDDQKGPAIELALGGTAKDFIREIPLDHKVNGCVFDPGDGAGPRQYTGASFIVTVLHMLFAHLDEEAESRSMLDLWPFRRRHGDSMDAYLA